ncbi:MAG: hypothetical protein U0325_08825 [Polyangiales bacterium]
MPRDPCGALRVAEVSGFDAKKYVLSKGLRANDRSTKPARRGRALAGLEHAGLKRAGEFADRRADEVGVGGVDDRLRQHRGHRENNRIAKLEDPRYLNPARFPNTVINSCVRVYVGDLATLQGPSTSRSPTALARRA